MRFVICLLLLVASLSACTTDTYESGEGELSQMRADFVVAYTNGESQMVSAMTDDGDSLLFSEPMKVKWAGVADSVYRLLLYHEPTDKAKTRPMSFVQMLTLDIRRAPADSANRKMDPLMFESLWMSKNRRFVNMGIALKTGQHDPKVLQALGVWCDTIMERDDGSRLFRLCVYHDQGGIPEYYSAKYYASIPLAPYAMRKGDEIELTVNTYQGIQRRSVLY